jgi:membrane protein DedA with SNARE-associated domain
VTSFVTHHGLPLLFAAVALESFGIPVPGETALIAFGVLAAQGHYSVAVVVAVAAAAAVIGDNLGFWLIGRRGGQALITRYAWIERRTQRVLPRAEALIARYGGRAVFFGRFVAVLRETIAWVAGLAGMSWRRFLFWNALGGVVWATGVGLLAYFGGKALADTVSRYGLYAVAAIVAALLIAAAPRITRRLRKRRSPAHPSGAQGDNQGRRRVRPGELGATVGGQLLPTGGDHALND